MHNLGTSADQQFEAPHLYLADLDADVMASVVAAACDLALVVDSHGVIRDISLGSSHTQGLGELRQWVGRRWVETVTVESRPKVTALLASVSTGHERDPQSGGRSERQVNHPLAGGLELPVSYRVVAMGPQGHTLAMGRDLRSVAAVQQRLVDAQQSMERDYLRLRHTEARYRLLFEAVDEAVLVVDALSLTVFEHNTAAARVMGESSKRIVGRSFIEFLAVESQAAAYARFSQARNSGRCEDLTVRLGNGANELKMAASLFKQDSAALLLVRLVQSGPAAEAALSPDHAGEAASLLSVVNAMPDAFVLTDLQGRVLSANQAFTDMLQLPGGETVQGQALDRWLGRSSVDLNVLIGNLRQHGVLKLFPTTLRSGYGDPSAVEISAVAVPDGAQPCLGFSIRDVSRRLSSDMRSNRQLPRSAEQLTGLVGRLPLKDIVGETTDLIERLCIEAALELTRDNRASAAEMLGLSRQSLYVKLRRFGIQDMGASAAGD
jgi:transcriptional regulator PpsR